MKTTLITAKNNNSLVSEVNKALKNNTRRVDYQPYSTAAKTNMTKLLLTINPVDIMYCGVVHRVLPMYKNTAVSSVGTVLDYDKMYIRGLTKTPYGYLVCGSYDVLNNHQVTIRIHRLVGMAWVANDSYVINNIVDHLDGNKLNNTYRNLRWVTNQENVAAGHHGGTLGKFKVTNLAITGLYSCHNSIRATARHLGIGKDTIKENKLPMIITGNDGNDYVVSLSTDLRTASELVEAAKDLKAVFKVINNETNESTRYSTRVDIVNSYDLGSVNQSVSSIATKLDKNGYTLVTIKNFNKGTTYDIKNLKTAIEHINLSRNKVLEMIGCGDSILTTRITRKDKYGYPINDWLIKYNSDKEYPNVIEFDIVSSSYVITKGDITKTFKSRSLLAKFFNVHSQTIERSIVSNMMHGGWVIQVI